MTNEQFGKAVVERIFMKIQRIPEKECQMGLDKQILQLEIQSTAVTPSVGVAQFLLTYWLKCIPTVYGKDFHLACNERNSQ